MAFCFYRLLFYKGQAKAVAYHRAAAGCSEAAVSAPVFQMVDSADLTENISVPLADVRAEGG